MAADRKQLEDALIRAHEAGDTQAAQVIADEIKGIGGEGTKAPSTNERLVSAGLKGFIRGGPIGALMGAGVSGEASKKLSEVAYEGGGRATDIATNLGASPEVAAGIGTAVNLGVEAIPSVVLGGAAGKLASPAMQGAARGLMQSAVKPERAARLSGKADKAIETMLQRDINATAGGLSATQAKVSALEDKVDDILKTSLGKVDPNDVAIKTLKDSLAKITYNTDPKSDMVIIDKAINTFLEHPQVEGMQNITVATANKLKQGITKALGDNKYGMGLAKPSSEVMTDKIRASNLRQAVASAEPTVAPSLAEQSELINVIKTLKPRVSVEGNKNIIGLGVLSPSMEKIAIWMLDRYPWFKSYLARTAYHGSERIPGVVVGGGVETAGMTQQK